MLILCKSTFLILSSSAEMSPKKPTFISILAVLDLILFNPKIIECSNSKKKKKLKGRSLGPEFDTFSYSFMNKIIFFLAFQTKLYILSLCLFPNKIFAKKNLFST